jgi:2-polyprenyl-6-hydroxyphenyl methylase / 3-demethylubiquinone-9 3-methyltransferase
MPSEIEAAPRPNGSVDVQEIDRFAIRAGAWWDPGGSFRALHRFNPARLEFIRRHLLRYFNRDAAALRPFTGLRLLDIGCGGGLVAEPMSRLGFAVTGLDAGAEAIAAARRHGEAAGLTIDYRVASVELLAAHGQQFDVVLALELIEHLADRNVFYRSLGELIRPDGVLIAATLNRTARSFAFAIVGAEYILRWLPQRTHEWRKFVRPSELASDLRRCGLHVAALAGLSFDLQTGEWSLSADLAVNYIAMAVRDRRGGRAVLRHRWTESTESGQS